MSTEWTSLKPFLEQCPVIPVLTVRDASHAAPLARALSKAGMTVIEVTLRTDCALEVIRAMADIVTDGVVGGGTAISSSDLHAVIDAGGRFAMSPGATPSLLEAGAAASIPFIPAVATSTEAILAREAGFQLMKLFPAEQLGGPVCLKALRAPLPDLRFCPTGGVDAGNLADYLELPNVAAVGGSWMVPDNLLMEEQFDEISDLARDAVEQAQRVRDSR